MGTAKSSKKILIYSPYWQILGGGEKYLLDIASSLENNHKVFLVADTSIKKKAKDTFGININNVQFLDPMIFKGQKFYNRFFFLRQFDICFYMTDGSLFYSGARKNYLIIQSPAHIPDLNIPSRFKNSGWKIICYSTFMQKIIKQRLYKESLIIPPAVDNAKFKSNRNEKSKIFLTVGRFFSSQLHEKNQEFLIDFFKKNLNTHFKGWKLYVCGNLTERSGLNSLQKLKTKIKDIPVKLFVNISFNQLLKYYQKASIYWHAAGFKSDPEIYPEKMEHFGITTVEAMSAGDVPVVYAAGGLTDIIEDSKSGFLWKTVENFLDTNIKIINNPKLRNRISLNAVKKAADYSLTNFQKKIYELV